MHACWRQQRDAQRLVSRDASGFIVKSPAKDLPCTSLDKITLHGLGRLVKDFAYFAIVAAALPFTLLEAAFRAGSTVMIEARPR